MSDTIQVRVYYEDTDLAGIVYYANYLKYIERGRTEYVRARGIDQRILRDVSGVVFAVRRVEADYIAPARYDDELSVVTRVLKLTGARVVMHQSVLRGEQLLFEAVVTLVALTTEGRPARLPAELRQQIGGP